MISVRKWPRQGSFRNQRASFVNGLFHAVGGWFAVFRDITPNSKNVRFSKGRESVGCHRLDKRQSSFIA